MMNNRVFMGEKVMKTCLSLLFLCFLLTGCAKTEIIDRIKIIQNIGFDIEGETYLGSASYPRYGKSSNEEPLLLLTAESQTMTGLLTSIKTQSQHPIKIDQMRTLVISEQLAKRGIAELASLLSRETMKSSNALVVITKQKTTTILSEALKYPPFYLSGLIEQNMDDGNTPVTNYHTLISQYYGEGQDTYLPAIMKNPNGLLRMDGVGVFKGDKIKLWLTNIEGLFLKLLTDKILSSSYEFTNEQKNKFSFDILSGKRKIYIVQNEKAVISLKLDIRLSEYPPEINILDTSDVDELKKQIQKHLTAEIKSVLDKLQKNAVDPIGLGDLYRSKQRKWSEKEFSDIIYPNLNFEVNLEIAIVQSGVGQ
jgi:spore germination protein